MSKTPKANLNLGLYKSGANPPGANPPGANPPPGPIHLPGQFTPGANQPLTVSAIKTTTSPNKKIAISASHLSGGRMEITR